MLARRTLLGLMAASLTTPEKLGSHSAGTSTSAIALGAISALDLLPEELRTRVVARSGTPDLAPFLQPALTRLGRSGGTLFFPAGCYDLSSLDLSQRNPGENGLTLIGAGRDQTILRAAVPGKVLLDASGRDNFSLLDIQLLSQAHVSICGLMLARRSDKPSCLRNRVHNVRVVGSYSVAAALAIAAESNSWVGCIFENSHAASGYACFVTAASPSGITPGSAGADLVPGSNTDNVMIDCEFYAPYDRATPVRFVGSAGYTMVACTVLGGSGAGTRLVTYVAREAIFSGPVSWHSPHLEAFGAGGIVHCLSGEGLCYFRGINSYSGNYQVPDGTALLARDPAVESKPILHNSTWTTPLIAQGTKVARVVLYGLTDSALAIRGGDDVGDVDITGFAVGSHVTAARMRIAQTVRDASACI